MAVPPSHLGHQALEQPWLGRAQFPIVTTMVPYTFPVSEHFPRLLLFLRRDFRSYFNGGRAEAGRWGEVVGVA